MAEVKNSFLASKMNRDLDDRLIPSNEYREAFNIAISQSEDSDVGAVENVRGTLLLESLTGGEVIGYVIDEPKDNIYLFWTSYTDTSNSQLVNHQASASGNGTDSKIYRYNVGTGNLLTLATGRWLNFSTTHPIYGVNVLEDLLFWTDNRNQPRKINTVTAAADSTHYSNEDHVSVAKYSPYKPIELFKDYSGTFKTTMKDATSVNLPDGSTANPDYNANYAGDPTYLEDKFARLSYRFKFEDGEYSIIAPFTQIAFIPKQDGSFIDKYSGSTLTESDEDDAYKSSIVKFMENKVNNIKLILPLEYQAGQIADKLKIIEVEILYKESDSNLVKSIEEIPISSFTGSNKFYEYDYQSTKPTKVLPSGQTTRVYDKVPVRAMAQEVSGNRVIYSNYVNKHTAPLTLDYSVNTSGKLVSTNAFTSRALEEYPEHTLKQNRNYQVGIVLSDRYGRQSGVILAENTSSLVVNTGEEFGSSTVYSPYKVADPKTFFGDSLKVLFNSEISSSRSPLTEFDIASETGEPGLYDATGTGIVSTLTISAIGNSYVSGTYNTTGGNGTGLTVVITVTSGAISGVVVANPGTGYSVGDIVSVDGPGAGQQGTLRITSLVQANPLGWYSYKIVVKQTEQEYYNVYVPDIISGNIETSTTAAQEENIAFISLINRQYK